jgi:prevent-host-death family protein
MSGIVVQPQSRVRPSVWLPSTQVLRPCLCPAMATARCYRQCMAYPLTAAQTHLVELVAEARQSHRPVIISEDGKPVAALINIDDLADLEDRAALAAHLADKAAGREGINLDELDPALDRIDAETLS